jgi:hypothetical protein
MLNAIISLSLPSIRIGELRLPIQRSQQLRDL